MSNAYFDKITQYRDVESLNYFKILKEQGMEEKEIFQILQARSRDNARTPMQWNQEANAGFTSGTPWIEVIHNYKDINVETSKQDEDSIYHHYRKLIKLRKKYVVISKGDVTPLLEEDKQAYAYQRSYQNERVLVINNCYKQPCEIHIKDLSTYDYLLSNYNQQELHDTLVLKAYESLILYKQV